MLWAHRRRRDARPRVYAHGDTETARTCRASVGWLGSDASDPGSAFSQSYARRGAMTLTEPSSVIAFPEDDLVDVAECDARCTVVWLQGEYDISTVTALSQTMARTMANEKGDLVVDLSGVQFMDAATIGVIIRTRNEMRLQLRSLTLRSPSPFGQR